VEAIIASSLFYKKTLRTRIIIGITLRTLLFAAIALALYFALQILLPQPYTAVQSNPDPQGFSMLISEPCQRKKLLKIILAED
jgi:hypothetical protein